MVAILNLFNGEGKATTAEKVENTRESCQERAAFFMHFHASIK